MKQTWTVTVRRWASPSWTITAVVACSVAAYASQGAIDGRDVPAAASALGISAAEWTSLDHGKVVVKGGSRGQGDEELRTQAAGFVVVRAPWRTAFAVVADHARAREYSSCTKKVEILSRESGDGRESVKTREEHKALWMTLRYTLDFVHDPEARQIRWALDPLAHNDVQENSGSWRFVPVSGGRVLVAYHIAGIPGRFPHFLLEFFVRRDLPRYLATLRRLVEAGAAAADLDAEHS